MRGMRVFTVSTALAAVLGLASVVQAQGGKGGGSEFSATLAQWQDAATQNDPIALYNLGQAYRMGYGVTADARKAAEFYERAARLGYARAQSNLASLLYFSAAPLQDKKAAVTWWQTAARGGDARAQYMMGVLHFNGDDVAKDWPRAFAYTQMALQAGVPEAAESHAQMTKHLSKGDQDKGRTLVASLIAPVGSPTPTVLASGTGARGHYCRRRSSSISAAAACRGGEG
jgi:uncharacterized protein